MSSPMPSDDISISVRNLTKNYRIFSHPGDRIKQAMTFGLRKYHKEFTAVKDVSFDIKKGETVGIIGRNGSGKSTLLQLICGILKPTSGTVQVNGRVSALLELGAGFNPEFTGRENVYFQGALMGLTKEDMDVRFVDIAAFADIGQFIDQPVRTYSSGMFVRLAFAVAIHLDPDILVVDEALAVGDMDFQAKCMTSFRRFHERGMTIIFVSHDLNAIKALCRQVIYLEQGEVKRLGEAVDVAEEYWRDIRAEQVVKFETSTVAEPIMMSIADFQKRTRDFRQGSGEARFLNVELLDSKGIRCIEAGYGQSVCLRLNIEFNAACEVAVSYFIRDDKQMILVGTSTVLEGYGLVAGCEGDRKILEFNTILPLTDGAYNVLAILSFPIIPNRSAQFVDFIENAWTFSVCERLPVKLWSKVYIPNKLTVNDG